jgi:tripartite-type tricarboxylate transporter receptor subunit TctC
MRRAATQIRIRGARVVAAAVFAGFSGFGIAAPAAAQTASYPTHPIKMIVPFTPGGPVDVAARIIGQRLPTILGQPVVIENRPGAAGSLGAKAVAAAEPDGYTLLCGNISTLVVLPVVLGNRDYDPAKQFVAVAKVSQNHEVLVVRADFAARSVAELIAQAKAHPGKLNYGSAGHGNATHLAAELFKLKTGTDIVHVPYKGAADAVTALLGAQVEMFFGDIAGVMPFVQQGTLRALAVSSERRNPLVPDVPTMIESGVPDYVVSTYIGVVAPTGTPGVIIGRLNTAINASLASPEAAAAFAKLGAEIKPGSPQEFASFLAEETARWAAVATAAKIKLE